MGKDARNIETALALTAGTMKSGPSSSLRCARAELLNGIAVATTLGLCDDTLIAAVPGPCRTGARRTAPTMLRPPHPEPITFTAAMPRFAPEPTVNRRCPRSLA